MARSTCPDCGANLVELTCCDACGWQSPFQPEGVRPRSRRDCGPRDQREGGDRPRRKRGRKRDVQGSEPRHFGGQLLVLLPFLAVLLAGGFWVGLFVVAINQPGGWYWLCAGGVTTFIVGSLWSAWAARDDGIELPMPWEGTGVFAAFQALVQLIAIPVITGMHLISNPLAALPSVLVLLSGVGMVVNGVLLRQ